MAEILNHPTALNIQQAVGNGWVPNYHLLVNPSRLRVVSEVSDRERVHGVCAAGERRFEPGAIVLTAANHTARGAQATQQWGGTVIAQAPAAAKHLNMSAAIAAGRVDDLSLPAAVAKSIHLYGESP